MQQTSSDYCNDYASDFFRRQHEHELPFMLLPKIYDTQ